MILFFVGIIEMTIAAFWTRAVAKANVMSTGVMTGVQFFIWYFVINQVVENLHNWRMILPYAAGCIIGSMIGVADKKGSLDRVKRVLARRMKNAPTLPIPAAGSDARVKGGSLITNRV